MSIAREREPAADKSTEVQLYRQLSLVTDGLRQELTRVLARHQLSVPAFQALREISRCDGDGCPMHRLVRVLMVSRANVTGLTDCLERKQLVARTFATYDRRVKLIRLTLAGLATLEAAGPQFDRRLNELFGKIDVTDQQSLRKLLSTVGAALEHAK